VLQDAINFGCALITALWMLLLSYWPVLMGVAAIALLAAFGTAARLKQHGIAAILAAGLVSLAAGLSAVAWLSADQMFGILPTSMRPFAQLLVVPAPLVLLYLAVLLLQMLLCDPMRPAR
jgi:hypothetical protein